VGGDLPRDRRGPTTKPASDGAEGLAGPDANEDLLAVSDAQRTRTRVPVVGHARRAPVLVDHDRHHLRGAADLLGDLGKPPPAGAETERQLLLLVRENPGHDTLP